MEDSWIQGYVVELTGGEAAVLMGRSISPITPTSEPMVVVYCQYHVDVNERCMLKQVQHNAAGKVLSPVTVLAWWRVDYVKRYRLDDNKSEFTVIQGVKNVFGNPIP